MTELGPYLLCTVPETATIKAKHLIKFIHTILILLGWCCNECNAGQPFKALEK